MKKSQKINKIFDNIYKNFKHCQNSCIDFIDTPISIEISINGKIKHVLT